MLLHRADPLGCNFNPRSHEGSDSVGSRSVPNTAFISIHAPTRGATEVVERIETPVHISIHAPTRGATNADLNMRSSKQKFQSTLPRGERQLSTNFTIYGYTYFNPRSHEGSDENANANKSNIEISIHAPTRGATGEIQR